MDIQPIFRCAVGMDVHRTTITVCVIIAEPRGEYAALEKVGIRALVVNAQHVKQVPGRKTAISDAEWLAMVARAG